MSGECEKCGEHTLDCKCVKQKYFYEGVCYGSPEDMALAVSRYQNSPLNPVSMRRILENAQVDIIMNILNFPLGCERITNQEFKALVENFVYSLIYETREKVQKRPTAEEVNFSKSLKGGKEKND